MEVQLEGQDRLFIELDRMDDRVKAAADAGLKRAGMKVIADAQRNLRTAGHNGGTLNATGRLSQSGRVQKDKDGTLDVGFFSQEGGRGYAAVVEYGSQKKWWPPVDVMRQWVKKKLRVPVEEINTVAFLISRMIAGRSPKHPDRYGLRPHPFFGPAVSKNQGEIEKAINDAVRNVIR